MTTCRIGVIGLGQRIAHVLAAMQEVGWDLRVDAHVDAAPVGAPILAAAGIALGRPCETPEALLREGPFDLLMLGGPNHLHREHLAAVFHAGVPIFAEKPIVRTEAETLDLARALAGPGAPDLYIGLVMRSLPIVREVIARVDSGDLGEIVSIDATEHLPPEHGGYLAPASRVGRLLPARQGVPRLRYLRSADRRAPGPGGELRRPPHLYAGARRAAPDL
jgi:predicted dehydrogenase